MKKLPLLIFLYLILLIGFILFFFFGPDYHSSRSFKTIWDQGHIFFYTIFMMILLHQWKRLSSCKLIKLYILAILLALLTGIPIELLQNRFDRIPEMGDVWRDILGCLIGITFFSAAMNQISAKYRRMLRLLVIILILIELSVPMKALTDEMYAKRQFPLIAGFETPFETDRWTADTRLERTQKQIYKGNFAARVTLNTDVYSRLSLKYFPRDWSNYQFLEFAVFYAGNQPLTLNCRINDGEHLQNNQASDDRFNHPYPLESGWNRIQISLDEVKNAPRNRRMNLKNIYDMTLFSYRLNESITLVIDEVKLVNKSNFP